MIKDYNPTGVKEVGEPDEYGNKAYSVFLEGESKPVFMKAKNPPVVGEIEHGQIIDAPKKSGDGTYRKFERKQREEGTPELGKTYAVNAEGVKEVNWSADPKQDSIVRQSALKSAVAAVGKPEPDQILSLADDFLNWLRNDDSPAEEEVPLPEPQGEVTTINESEVSLDDIPF